MTEIFLETQINAPVEVCFRASLDVGLHLGSAASTGERVVAGRTSGICELGDEITWAARHFGVKQQLSVRITDLEFPRFFADQMTRGAFKSMRHEHYFEPLQGGCLMKDKFMYETPFWIFGKVFDVLLLKRHMRAFLLQRNMFLKAWCEGRGAL
ncbi:MAG: SRPBCC family protein [Turneriella sp.]